MSRRQSDPLRALTEPEQAELTRLSRSRAAPAAQVARAAALLAVASGLDYQQAAHAAGRRSGDAVSHLVARFNHEGLDAVVPRHAGGPVPSYGAEARERILREASRTPTPEETARRLGRSRRRARPSARPRTACRRSPLSPSGRRCARRA